MAAALCQVLWTKTGERQYLPNVISSILYRAMLFTRPHPASVAIHHYGIKVSRALFEQDMSYGLSVLGVCHEGCCIKSIAETPAWRRNKTFTYKRVSAVDMHRCRIGMFLADKIHGNSIVYVTPLPGRQYLTTNGVRELVPLRNNMIRFMRKAKVDRSDCGHQAVMMAQVCAVCKIAICELCYDDYRHRCLCDMMDYDKLASVQPSLDQRA